MNCTFWMVFFWTSLLFSMVFFSMVFFWTSLLFGAFFSMNSCLSWSRCCVHFVDTCVLPHSAEPMSKGSASPRWLFSSKPGLSFAIGVELENVIQSVLFVFAYFAKHFFHSLKKTASNVCFLLDHKKTHCFQWSRCASMRQDLDWANAWILCGGYFFLTL